MQKVTVMASVVLLAGSAWAQSSATKNSAQKKPAKAVPVAAQSTITPLTIPKDAVKSPDGSWSYTDPQGKRWTYTATPFGVSKVAYVAPTQASGEPKVVDLGDSVRFEMASPFGSTVWEKKKSELSENERKLVEAHQVQAQPASNQ